MIARLSVVNILDPITVEVLRRKTPADRLAEAFQVWNTARLVISSAVRQQHPDWNDDQILRETVNRLSHGATERVPR